MSPRPNMRHRISKDDIRRRLTERRSTLSPSPEPARQFDSVMERMESLPTPERCMLKNGELRSPDVVIPILEEPLADSTDWDKERDGMSIVTMLTDVSTETATVQQAERMNIAGGLPTPDSLSDKEFGMLSSSPNLQVNFGSKFSLGGMGFGRGDASIRSKTGLGTTVRGGEKDSGSVHSMKMGNVDVSMDMKSALDRLMDDVAGAGGREEDSIMTDEHDKSYDQSIEIGQPKIQRAATDSDLLNEALGRTFSGSSTSSIPPPLPPKENQIKAREQLILEKRREARRADEGRSIHTRGNGQRLQSQLGIGRPSRRRSMSAGDAHDLARRLDQLPNVGSMEQLAEEDPLSQCIERELKKLGRNPSVAAKKSVSFFYVDRRLDAHFSLKQKYQIREHEGTIYASASEDKISHLSGAGDVDTGRAWRTVRRPSDMV